MPLDGNISRIAIVDLPLEYRIFPTRCPTPIRPSAVQNAGDLIDQLTSYRPAGLYPGSSCSILAILHVHSLFKRYKAYNGAADFLGNLVKQVSLTLFGAGSTRYMGGILG